MQSIFKPALTALCFSVLVSGCASNSRELEAAHVSTAGYKGLSCPELHAELQSSINIVHELAGVLDEKAEGDKAQMAIGMILFWPALFALEGGDGAEAAEFSRVKGEINAMENVAILKECQPAIDVAKNYHADEQLARLEEQKAKDAQQAKASKLGQ
ncbi:hypothetical protein [uncultured Amphritea sp.]|uniref:hypothetical protein n=1 Tax=uncultured Amphritea sp. TaxID=981605 RepID=UPI0026196453|nr:hypothetical protein [uncultured Amphritea sp.]